MASFHEVQFPLDISYESQGGPRFSTEIIKKRSGSEERVARWSYPLHVYNVKTGLRAYSNLVANFKDFFIRRLGPAHGFRYKDPLDFTTDPNPDLPYAYRAGSVPAFTNVNIGVGDNSTKTFQLFKEYADSIITRHRNIYKPIFGTVKVGVNGVEKAIATDWSVDTTTGIVTINVAPSGGQLVSAGFEFDTPVRFDDSLDDGLLLTLSSPGGGDIPDIPILEEFAPSVTSDEYFYGGAYPIDFAVDISVTPLTGRFLRLNPSAAGLSVRLPDPVDLEDGGPWFYLVNVSGTNSVSIKNFEGSNVFTLAAATGAEVLLGTFSGAKTWYGF